MFIHSIGGFKKPIYRYTNQANVYAVQYIKGIFAWFEMGSIIEIFIGWKTYRNTILYKTKLKKEETSSSQTSYVFLL